MSDRPRPLAGRSHANFPDRRRGPEESLYFLIRWKPPYRFTVAEISGKGRPDCTIEDPRVEETQGLFGVAK